MSFYHLVGARTQPRSPQLSIFIILETKLGDVQHAVAWPLTAFKRPMTFVDERLNQAVVVVTQVEKGGT